jgi:dTDP-4-amino-4,6-dideoxygalactose transaminase
MKPRTFNPEAGSLLLRDGDLVLRAEIMREKGKDRGRFFRGEADKYTWQSVGSSFLPSKLAAVFLRAQFEEAERITGERVAIWQRYHEWLALRAARLTAPLDRAGGVANLTGTSITFCCHRELIAGNNGLPQKERRQHGVPLCPAALFAGGFAVWPRTWRASADDLAFTASD